VGDLLEPADVLPSSRLKRVYFACRCRPDTFEATVTMATVARAVGVRRSSTCRR